MSMRHQEYEEKNLLQHIAESDPFTSGRYEQFYHFFPRGGKRILDIGCNTGRGGVRLKQLDPSLHVVGLDCVRSRVAELPECYDKGICGLSNAIPVDDRSFDVVVAGEFLEHLYPADVDATLCEFQRVLRVQGRLLITTPNPHYLKSRVKNLTIYSRSHLTQHFPRIMKIRLQMHGFANVKIIGSGKMTRYLGYRFPWLSVYGSYLIWGDKI